MRYIVYDADGTILRTGSCPESMVRLQPDREQFVYEGEADDSLHYIDIGTEERRDKHEITATLSGLTLTDLPIPATVTIEGVPYEVTDGTAELAFNLPGTYQVLAEALHYLPKTFEVTV